MRWRRRDEIDNGTPVITDLDNAFAFELALAIVRGAGVQRERERQHLRVEFYKQVAEYVNKENP